MDIADILSKQAPTLLNTLQDSGLSADQAKDFLPAASEQFSTATSGAGIASLLGGGGVEELLKNIDIGAIAEKVGIDEALVDKALQSLAPAVIEALQGSGGATSMLGGLAGKLFK